MLAAAGTPYLLLWTAPQNANWSELSEISQTYAAVSLPLTAAALLGAVASLRYQARQTRISREDSRNATHRELLTAAREDPDLLVCWGPLPVRLSPVRWKQMTYVNSILVFWHSQYILTNSPEADAAVRFNAHRLFRGEIGHEFWVAARSGWQENMSGGERSRRFLAILEEEFNAAQAEGPPVSISDFFSPN